jgi:hypothetical protein
MAVNTEVQDQIPLTDDGRPLLGWHYTYEQVSRICRPEEDIPSSAHIRWTRRRVAAGVLGYVEGKPRHVTGQQIIAYIERQTRPALRHQRGRLD